jgi:hypothetical protein
MCKWIKSGNQRIDPCMKETVEELQWKGYHVKACCCGHIKYKPSIIVENYGTVYDYVSGIIIERTKRFYKRDNEGHFFIPEVI